MTNTQPKIAVIYDQSMTTRGDNHILKGLHESFPTAVLYRSPLTRSKITKILHHLIPKRQITWFEELDLSSFDVIISYGAKAKHIIKTRDNQLHIHYTHTLAPQQKLEEIDNHAAKAVDLFIATSSEAQRSIKDLYDRPATVINPPIETSLFIPDRQRDNYYVLIDGDNTSLVTKNAAKLGIRLRILTHTDDEATIRSALNSAKGYISLNQADFDTTQIEALAAGAFVVAYSPHAATDIIQDSETGVLFHELTVDAITEAITKAEAGNTLPGTLRRKSKRFDQGLFITKLRKIVTDKWPR